LDSVFTLRNLEKCPTLEPSPFVAKVNAVNDSDTGGEEGGVLTVEEGRVLERVVRRVRGKIAERRIDVLSYFEDFDFVREGTITTNQFRSVLHTLSLPVDDHEIRVLARRFATTRSLDRINYRAFAAIARGVDELEAQGVEGVQGACHHGAAAVGLGGASMGATALW
ncbi:hypothetical protein HK104_010407, partial [Borealophlyctis nickersoniae]